LSAEKKKLSFTLSLSKGKQFVHALFFLALFFSSFVVVAEEEHPVVILEVRGTIDPAQARYVARGLEQARERQASAVLLEMDTPGGLDGSMRRIVQEILNSPVPVIVYVAPEGARAASAGAFITLAAHVSAMAPGTNIGAAHPVQMSGGAVEMKITNDAAAYIHSIADLRGRDTAWAEAAVRESISSTAEEAREKGIIDHISSDREDLLRQMEGRPVRTVFGVASLAFQGQPRVEIEMSLMEGILHQLAHPNLAYILLLLGIYGLIYELATPGAVFPGVLGAIFLILALAALETLAVNWAGVAMIVLSLLFFIADIKLPGYGALTIGGIIAFILGSLILFPGARIPGLRLPWATIGSASAVTAIFFLGIVGVGLRVLKRKVTSGAEGLVGAEGEAKTDLLPEGIVLLHGESWRARARVPVRQGDRVRVLRLEGLTVWVEPVKGEGRLL